MYLDQQPEHSHSCQKAESITPTSPTIQRKPDTCEPTPFDVLCSKDSKAFLQHTGNNIYRHLILHFAEKSPQHELTDRKARLEMTRRIITILQNRYNTRFLGYSSDDACWRDIGPLATYKKVWHALRLAAAIQRLATAPTERKKAKAAAKRKKSKTVSFSKSIEICYYSQQPSEGDSDSNSLLPDDEPLILEESEIEDTSELNRLYQRQQEIFEGLM